MKNAIYLLIVLHFARKIIKICNGTGETYSLYWLLSNNRYILITKSKSIAKLKRMVKILCDKYSWMNISFEIAIRPPEQADVCKISDFHASKHCSIHIMQEFQSALDEANNDKK